MLSKKVAVFFHKDEEDSLCEQGTHIKALSHDMQAIEERLALQPKAEPPMRRIVQIPGVGLLTATVAIATMGEASAFKSGREFCASLGLVLTQTGSGDKVRLGSLIKRGDTYLRTLCVHGARSVRVCTKAPGAWLEELKTRRPVNLVVVAQAAKMARTIRAVTAYQMEQQRGLQSVRLQVRPQVA